MPRDFDEQTIKGEGQRKEGEQNSSNPANKLMKRSSEE
jgi:hypothetical protein